MEYSYLCSVLNIAWESATAEAVVIELLISGIVVFVIRRLQNAKKLIQLTDIARKILIVEDDYGRTIITFVILFAIQIIFVSPYRLYQSDQRQIGDLSTKTNQLTLEKIQLTSDNKNLFTNNAYIHDQWNIALNTSQNYQTQVNYLNQKIQEQTKWSTTSIPTTNAPAQASSQSVTNSPPVLVSQYTNRPAFDLFLNHKYVSTGAIIPLEQSRKIFFQVVNTGSAPATNLTVIFISPLNDTNFVFDFQWTKRPFEPWVAVNHQMYDVSETCMMQIVSQGVIVPTQGFNVSAFGIATSVKSFSFSIAELKKQGWAFPNLPESVGTFPYLPAAVTLLADNATPQTYFLDLQFLFMHLKEAIARNKLPQFIREREKIHPRASKKHFHAVLKSMISGTAKPKRGTSRKDSRAG